MSKRQADSDDVSNKVEAVENEPTAGGESSDNRPLKKKKGS